VNRTNTPASQLLIALPSDLHSLRNFSTFDLQDTLVAKMLLAFAASCFSGGNHEVTASYFVGRSDQ
jgi:hypothetical protein